MDPIPSRWFSVCVVGRRVLEEGIEARRTTLNMINHFAILHPFVHESYNGIEGMLYGLGIDGGDSIARPALRFYEIAVEKNFTRGRRKEQVQAACLYIACRYILGAVFLQLCKILSLEEHPIVQKPVDPSLFIHRFTDRLFGGRRPNISRSALHILASMKRDWMQMGRNPSGLCGAALYIASLSHGLSCSKSEIIKVVHICEATLTKRLIELENTESGSLTIDEFNTRAEELEKEERLALQLYSGSKGSGITEVDGYLHNEQEKRYKKIIWETMNREYLEGSLCSGSFLRFPCVQDRKTIRLSSKINYDVVDKLFDESGPENPKKTRHGDDSTDDNEGPENPKKTRHGDDSTDDNEVKSNKIDPEVDETYDEALGEDLHYDDDVGGYGYDQHYDYDDYCMS
ncbi:hypothetical protein RND71_007731 [Anisodus tanguticus]|uniref:Transcription factor IIIB 90 kDa subunit n=1 Tax=Anisodus tanguticus TaxID=243964 RepID=A0AAE1SN82_9SOLA|nr:hypothetical protein RND71_007731 [Anisodus tanguticus]